MQYIVSPEGCNIAGVWGLFLMKKNRELVYEVTRCEVIKELMKIHSLKYTLQDKKFLKCTVQNKSCQNTLFIM